MAKVLQDLHCLTIGDKDATFETAADFLDTMIREGNYEKLLYDFGVRNFSELIDCISQNDFSEEKAMAAIEDAYDAVDEYEFEEIQYETALDSKVDKARGK